MLQNQPAPRSVPSPLIPLLPLKETPPLRGRYKLEAQIGAGRTGVVYRAFDQKTQKHCAIKMLRASESAPKALLLRFENEARILGLHPHPGILSAFAFDVEEGGRPFIVMDLLHGEDLNAYLRRQRRLPLLVCYRLLRQAASALYHLHQLGIVHRDIKPANLFLCVQAPFETLEEDAQIKILDFGTAKILGQEMASTVVGDILGTPCFCAPELLDESGGTVDPLADQFSLATTGYLMLSGVSPFAGETLLETIERIRKYHPAPLNALRAEIPDPVARVFQRALSKRKTDRFPCVGSFMRALKEAIDAPVAVAASPVQVSSRAAQPSTGMPASTLNLGTLSIEELEAELSRTQQIEPSLLESLRARSERSGKQQKPALSSAREPVPSPPLSEPVMAAAANQTAVSRLPPSGPSRAVFLGGPVGLIVGVLLALVVNRQWPASSLQARRSIAVPTSVEVSEETPVAHPAPAPSPFVPPPSLETGPAEPEKTYGPPHVVYRHVPLPLRMADE